MFAGDDYLVLISGGHLAMAALSGVLVFGAVAAVRLARRHVTLLAAAPALGLVFWWLFLWLTPQLYYIVYVSLDGDLPFELIIGWPPGPRRLMALLAFQGGKPPVDPALGALGWVMILASLPRA